MSLTYLGITAYPLTRDLVNEFRSLPTYSGDRDAESKRGKRHLAWLNNIFDSGLFYSPRWARVLVKSSGTMYRINGNHSSLMLQKRLDEEFPTQLQVIMDDFACDTELDLPDQFDQFDQPPITRTRPERLQAHIHAEPSLRDKVNFRHIENCTRGVAYYIMTHNEVKNPDTNAQICLVHTHQPFMIWSEGILTSEIMRKNAITAAIYATYLLDEDESKVFWHAVKHPTDNDNNQPARELAFFLLKAQQEGGDSWHSLCIYTKCLLAWNAFRRGGTTKLRIQKRKKRIEAF